MNARVKFVLIKKYCTLAELSKLNSIMVLISKLLVKTDSTRVVPSDFNILSLSRVTSPSPDS